MGNILSYTPYVLAAATIAIGLFDLIKEWDSNKHSWLKIGKAVAMVVVAALTFVSLRQDETEKQQRQNETQTLERQVSAANDALTRNTNLFISTFRQYSDQIADLKTQVRTEELQKKLTSVQEQLEVTQKALVPPKATLAFTFWPFTNPPLGSNAPPIPSIEKSLPVNSDGSVHIEFTILNLTTVDALDGSVTLQICDDCKYAKEPVNFHRVAGDMETQRILSFPSLLAMEFYPTLSVDLIPPATVQNMVIGFSYRCKTCVLADKPSIGTVHLQRDFLKHY